MKWTRRRFLGVMGSAAAALALPWFGRAAPARRPPYIQVGDQASYIGRSPGGFCGACVVVNVGEWDGASYPVTVRANVYPARDEVYPDTDLADFNRDVPRGALRARDWWETYPNVHTYVRMQRYGETREEAVRYLNFYSTRA